MAEQTEITKGMLEGYRSKKEEIKELQYKLKHLGEGDSMVGNDTIFDYRSGYPQPQAVVGVDWGKVSRADQRYRKKIFKLEQECQTVEEFIENIEDSFTRRMFRMLYIDGMTQEKISKKMHISQSTLSKKVKGYITSHCK